MRVLLKNRSQFPKYLRDYQEVKGICIGGCVYGKKFVASHPRFQLGWGHSAHTHGDTGYKYSGWMCLKYKCQLKDTMVLLHELAHLLVGENKGLDHGKEWKQMVVSIGGTFKSMSSHDGKHWYPDYTHRHR